MLQIGSLLDNKYKILNEIGRGGMSVVYLAINEKANKTWAVKEFRRDGTLDSEEIKQRLIAETDMLKRLSHRFLPAIVDVIDTPDSFFIVMDYIEGLGLQKLLESQGRQPEEKVVKWAKQLCEVLGYLHSQDPPIIYRDMKPANVILKPNGDITLIDFGAAREHKNRQMIQDTTCLGTRGYAAPEQFGGIGQTDCRTDIYCLGATIYHLLTGHSPAGPPYEIKPLSYWLTQYAGSGLEKLILKCTQPDPADRYQSCEELMYALEHYRDEDDVIRRKRKKHLELFAVFAAVGITALAGALVFNGMKVSAAHQSFDYRLELAENAKTLSDSGQFYIEAFKIDASNPEAYESLLSKVSEDIDNNNAVLTTESELILNNILTNVSNGSESNINILKREHPDRYTMVMYRVGLWHFFMMEDTDNNRAIASSRYLANIQDDAYSRYLASDEQRELSRLLYNIGNYLGRLCSGRNRFDVDSSENESYEQFFEDIGKIVSENLKELTGRDIYAIRIYEQAAAWINEKEKNFENCGISANQMLEVLDMIKTGLKSLSIENENYSDYISAMETVENTTELIKAAGGE